MDSEIGPDELWAKRHDVIFKAWVQLRYHRNRQRRWDLADKLTKIVTIVLGASLFGQYVASSPAVGIAVASLGLLALILGYTDRRQVHKELGEQAAALIASIEQVPAGEITPAKAAMWKAEFLRICMKAPPQLKWLTLVCEREQAIADGHPDHIPELPRIKRLIAHIV